jgi:hypothetical protein
MDKDYIKLAQEMLGNVREIRTQENQLQIAQVYTLLAIAQEVKRLNDMLEDDRGLPRLYVLSC